ncbi:MAG: hypothetical protein AAGK04_06295 [Planctomycetota bacterium]
MSALLLGGAQMLDLDAATGPPAPGESGVWPAHAETLRNRADAASDGVAERARAATDRFAAALLDRAEALGADGSAHALVALQLAHGASLIDHADPRLRVIEARMRRLAASPPDDPRTLARLVRPLAIDSSVSAPTGSMGSLGGDIDRWSSLGLGSEATAALRSLDAELLEASDLPAMRSSAAALRTTLRAAGEALDAPDWLGETVPRRARSTFEDAIERLMPRDTDPNAAARDEAEGELRRLARVWRGVSALDALSIDDSTRAARDAWRARLAQDMLEAATLESADALDRLSSTLRHPDVSGEADLLQALRPMHRALARERRAARARLLAALPSITEHPHALSDPNITGVIAAWGRLDHAARHLRALDAVCREDPRTNARADGERLAQRVLELSRGLDRSASRIEFDASMARLQRLARDADRFGSLTATADLNGATGALLGDQAPRLRAVFDDAAGTLFNAWIDGADARSLADHRDTLERYADLAERLGRLPTFESATTTRPPIVLDPSASPALAARLERSVRPAVRAAIARDERRLRRALANTDAVLIVARAFAALRSDTAQGLADATRWIETPLSARVELARYAAELAMALALGQRPHERLVAHTLDLIERVESER